MAKRYLVTGASGFVGRYLVRHLAEASHQVFGVVRTKGKIGDLPAEEVVCDLMQSAPIAKEVARIKPDGIFHLAAPETSVGHSWQSPAETISANIDSTLTVLEAARNAKPAPKIVFVSSAEVLGPVEEDKQPINEESEPNPTNPYATSKLMGEAATAFYFRQFDVPACIVRPFTHIGVGQRGTFVVPSIARQVAGAESRGGGKIKVGNLSARRDFSDVRDIVAAYAAVMDEGKPGEVYHAASGEVLSIEEVAKFLAQAATAKIAIEVDPALVRPNDIPLLAGDATKLRTLGWKPAVPLEQTLQEILEAARAALKKEAK